MSYNDIVFINQGDPLINNDTEEDTYQIGIYKYKHTLETTMCFIYKPINKLSVLSNERRLIHIYFDENEYLDDAYFHESYCYVPTIYLYDGIISCYDAWITTPIQIPEYNNIVDLMIFISKNTIGINGITTSNWKSKYGYKGDISIIH